MQRKRTIIALCSIAAVAGGLLGLVWNITKPEIEKRRIEASDMAIYAVLPEAEKYQEMKSGTVKYYQAYDAEGKPAGIAIRAEGQGFQDKILMIIGMTQDLSKIKGIRILESSETPGLGGEITSNWFRKQFENLETKPEIVYVKNSKPEKPNEIRAITGATISTKAVVKIINEAVKNLRDSGLNVGAPSIEPNYGGLDKSSPYKVPG